MLLKVDFSLGRTFFNVMLRLKTVLDLSINLNNRSGGGLWQKGFQGLRLKCQGMINDLQAP